MRINSLEHYKLLCDVWEKEYLEKNPGYYFKMRVVKWDYPKVSKYGFHLRVMSQRGTYIFVGMPILTRPLGRLYRLLSCFGGYGVNRLKVKDIFQGGIYETRKKESRKENDRSRTV